MAELSATLSPAGRSSHRRVIALALPIIGESLLQTLLGIIDTILVARVSLAALAGVGAAQQIIGLLVAVLTALSVGASVLVAQAIGAGERERAAAIARQALIWGVLASPLLTAIGLLSAPALVGWFGLERDVGLIAHEYLGVTLGSLVIIVVQLVAGGVLRGAGDSRTPFLASLLSNILNVPLSYALIFGAAGLPALGAVGSAWGTAIARLVGAGLLLALLIRGRSVLRLGRAGWWPQPGQIGATLRLGLPAAAEEVLLLGSMAALTPIAAGLGTLTLAAHRIVLNALSLSFLPGIAFAIAATILVGQQLGAGKPEAARRTLWAALCWGVLWMSVVGMGFALFAPQVVRIFADPADPQTAELVQAGQAGLIMSALAQPFWAACMILAGALRGAGQTRLPLLISGGASWLAVAVAWAVVQLWPGLTGLWAGFVIIFPIEMLLLWWAWRTVLCTIGQSTEHPQC